MSWKEESNLQINFGVPNQTIERTLRFSDDAYSGIKISSPETFQNTRESLNDVDEDKRFPLGLFYFEEDNVQSTNFPIKFNNSIFNQLVNDNLINNGDCRRIEKRYVNS